MTQIYEGSNRQKICRVCGDKAMGFNFNAISCESCKAFFRRNAFKAEKLRCPFNSDCAIDVATRRFCQKCRLEKCFQIGMKKEWILSEEQKKVKRAKIEENRARRASRPDGGCDSDSGQRSQDQSYSRSTSPGSQDEIAYHDHSVQPNETQSNLKSISSSSSSLPKMINDGNQYVPNFTYNHTSSNNHQLSGLASPTDFHMTIPGSGSHLSRVIVSLRSLGKQQPELNETSHHSTNYPDQVTNEHHEEQSHYQASRELLLPDHRPSSSSSHLITTATNILNKDLFGNLDDDWISLMTETNDNNKSIQTSTCQQQSTNTIYNEITQFSCAPVITSSAKGTQVSNSNGQLSEGKLTESTYDRQAEWRIRVNHRILEANFTPLYLKNDKYDSNGTTLNSLEILKINELSEAFSLIDEPLLENLSSDKSDLNDVIKYSDIAIRRLIKWCKRIQAFASLCLDDQIALLKAGCLEMLSMKASYNFNLDAETWQDYHTKRGLHLDIFKKASKNLYEAHRQFIKTFDQRWRTDHKVNLLLVAIVLFNPERPNLLHPETIRLEHCTYIYLLRRYLETKCDSLCQARTDHYHLMMKIEDLRELHEKTSKLYSEAGPEAVGPLLIEILDLK